MELVNKEDVIKILEKHSYNSDDPYFIDLAADEIYDLPVVESDRATGHWIDTGMENVFGGKPIECSACGFRIVVSPEHYSDLSYYERFCSHCGSENVGITYTGDEKE